MLRGPRSEAQRPGGQVMYASGCLVSSVGKIAKDSIGPRFPAPLLTIGLTWMSVRRRVGFRQAEDFLFSFLYWSALVTAEFDRCLGR